MAENIKNLAAIDASFVLAFLLDEGNVEVESIFERHALGEITLICPSLTKYEVGNGLKTRVFRKKLKKSLAQRLYRLFFELKIIEQDPDYPQTLVLALAKNLSFYDASYLNLSVCRKIPLLTLDKRLKSLSR